jgi:hypothetical protein
VASLPLATTNNCGEELCGLAIAAYIRVGLLRGTWVEEGASTLAAQLSVPWFTPRASPEASANLLVAMAWPKMDSISV